MSSCLGEGEIFAQANLHDWKTNDACFTSLGKRLSAALAAVS